MRVCFWSVTSLKHSRAECCKVDLPHAGNGFIFTLSVEEMPPDDGPNDGLRCGEPRGNGRSLFRRGTSDFGRCANRPLLALITLK